MSWRAVVFLDGVRVNNWRLPLRTSKWNGREPLSDKLKIGSHAHQIRHGDVEWQEQQQ